MKKQIKQVPQNVCSGGAVYGLGLIGALVYFIQQSSSFLDVIVGIFKAIVWPAFLFYNLFNFLRI